MKSQAAPSDKHEQLARAILACNSDGRFPIGPDHPAWAWAMARAKALVPALDKYHAATKGQSK